MLKFEPGGDIFNPMCDVLIIPTNTKGVMGAGLALAFAKRFPAVEAIYKKRCKDGELSTSFIDTYFDGKKTFVFFSTKRNPWEASHIDYVDASLLSLSQYLKDLSEYTTVGLPQVGCGLGGLEWTEVRNLVKRHLSLCTQTIVVYGPDEGYLHAPKEESVASRLSNAGGKLGGPV